jgi:hypothetical protein
MKVKPILIITLIVIFILSLFLLYANPFRERPTFPDFPQFTYIEHLLAGILLPIIFFFVFNIIIWKKMKKETKFYFVLGLSFGTYYATETLYNYFQFQLSKDYYQLVQILFSWAGIAASYFVMTYLEKEIIDKFVK